VITIHAQDIRIRFFGPIWVVLLPFIDFRKQV